MSGGEYLDDGRSDVTMEGVVSLIALRTIDGGRSLSIKGDEPCSHHQ
jgi:hypothetical protein